MSSPGGGRNPIITKAKADPADAVAAANRKKAAAAGMPSAARNAPKFRIPVHVLVYSLLLTPVGAYYVYYKKNKKSDEEMEEILNKDEFYQQRIQASQRSRQDFQKFFDNMKDGNTKEFDNKMSEVLTAGKGGGSAHQESNSAKKRLYAVDETLLGTEEGARLSAENLERVKQKQAQIKQREKESRLKKKKKKKKSTKEDGSGSENEAAFPDPIPPTDANNIKDSQMVKTAAAAVATGTVVAVVASVLFSGGRSSR